MSNCCGLGYCFIEPNYEGACSIERKLTIEKPQAIA